MPHDSKKKRTESGSRRSVRVGLLMTVVVGAAGCTSLDGVRQLPPREGVRAAYHASSEEVAEVLPSAVESAGMEVAVHRDSLSGGLATIGERGWNLLTYGHYTRALVRSRDEGSELHVLTRPKLRTEAFSPAGRASLRVIASVDEALGPRRIAPYDGMRVRGSAADGTAVEGVLHSDGRGSFLLQSSDATAVPRRPLETFEEVSVHRGSFGRGMEGGLVGSLVGVFVGFLIDGGCDDLVCPLIPAEAFWGGAVGALSGGVIGSVIRTHVWSPMAPPGGRR